MRVYIDSDTLIWHLRGEAKAAALPRRLSVEPERSSASGHSSAPRSSSSCTCEMAGATGGKIYTQNLKYYPMPNVAVLKGW